LLNYGYAHLRHKPLLLAADHGNILRLVFRNAG